MYINTENPLQQDNIINDVVENYYQIIEMKARDSHGNYIRYRSSK
jgi:hypothetical protein